MDAKLIAGDSLNLLNSYPEYPASAGWVLTTKFIPRLSTATVITLNAVAENDDFRTTAAASTTASWTPGVYEVQQVVALGADRITLASGSLQILPDPFQAAPGVDSRSHVEKTLAAIESMLEGKATKDVQEYTIGDRQLKHIPLPELLVWRDKYAAQLAAEKRSKKLGKTFARKIYTRF